MARKPMSWETILRLVGAYAIAMPAFFSVVSFAAAITPQKSGGKMPAEWSGGVMNHGQYYEWYTIGDQPALFLLSVVVLALSGGYIVRTFWKHGDGVSS